MEYWNDDTSMKVGYWEVSPKIYKENKCEAIIDFPFESLVTTSVNQWNTALDLSMTYVTSKSNADIAYYGAVHDDYRNATGSDIGSKVLGVTN